MFKYLLLIVGMFLILPPAPQVDPRKPRRFSCFIVDGKVDRESIVYIDKE